MRLEIRKFYINSFKTQLKRINILIKCYLRPNKCLLAAFAQQMCGRRQKMRKDQAGSNCSLNRRVRRAYRGVATAADQQVACLNAIDLEAAQASQHWLNA
jgi:hypothetical protein